ncbi:MAG: hypothetical protein ACFB9N_10260 [Geitlerinemataceae cyanobacterium]
MPDRPAPTSSRLTFARSPLHFAIGACLLLGLASCGGGSRYTRSYCQRYYDRVNVNPGTYNATTERSCMERHRNTVFFYGGGSRRYSPDRSTGSSGTYNSSPSRGTSGSFRGGGPGSGK